MTSLHMCTYLGLEDWGDQSTHVHVSEDWGDQVHLQSCTQADLVPRQRTFPPGY